MLQNTIFTATLAVLVLIIGVLYFRQERCPKGGLHRWKKVRSESVVGSLAIHHECKKCGKEAIALPMKNIPY